MYNWLKGKKTYAIAIVLIVLNGLVALGYLSNDQVNQINIVLGALGLATLRAGVAKAETDAK